MIKSSYKRLLINMSYELLLNKPIHTIFQDPRGWWRYIISQSIHQTRLSRPNSNQYVKKVLDFANDTIENNVNTNRNDIEDDNKDEEKIREYILSLKRDKRLVKH
jgi:hypothetical protein